MWTIKRCTLCCYAYCCVRSSLQVYPPRMYLFLVNFLLHIFHVVPSNVRSLRFFADKLAKSFISPSSVIGTACMCVKLGSTQVGSSCQDDIVCRHLVKMSYGGCCTKAKSMLHVLIVYPHVKVCLSTIALYVTTRNNVFVEFLLTTLTFKWDGPIATLLFDASQRIMKNDEKHTQN